MEYGYVPPEEREERLLQVAGVMMGGSCRWRGSGLVLGGSGVGHHWPGSTPEGPT